MSKTVLTNIKRGLFYVRNETMLIFLQHIMQIPSGAGKKLTDEDLVGKSQDEIEMMRIMGFGSFDTTKNKKVIGLLSKMRMVTKP